MPEEVIDTPIKSSVDLAPISNNVYVSASSILTQNDME